jgi:hypothetical protein
MNISFLTNNNKALAVGIVTIPSDNYTQKYAEMAIL